MSSIWNATASKVSLPICSPSSSARNEERHARLIFSLRASSTLPTMPDIQLPDFGDELEEVMDGEGAFAAGTTYTIEKDDTLQKISKKFYDSFSQWHRIYEANRAAIKNPDRLKPGTVITIPVEK